MIDVPFWEDVKTALAQRNSLPRLIQVESRPNFTMGHERTGTLPKSDRWRDVVDHLSDFSGTDSDVSEVASRVADNVKKRLGEMHRDSGVQAAFQFLVHLTVAARSEDPVDDLNRIGIELPPEPSPLTISAALKRWTNEQVSRGDSMEYLEIATSAASDAITEWYSRHPHAQSDFFSGEVSSLEAWKEAGDGGGFSEVARSYFAKFTERYLKYFLDREASAKIKDLEVRESFQEKLSKHAYEKSKITQSFAAGWYNKYASESSPSREEVRNFLNIAFGKLKGELSREE